jgi:hypothetical protein
VEVVAEALPVRPTTGVFPEVLPTLTEQVGVAETTQQQTESQVETEETASQVVVAGLQLVPVQEPTLGATAAQV